MATVAPWPLYFPASLNLIRGSIWVFVFQFDLTVLSILSLSVSLSHTHTHTVHIYIYISHIHTLLLVSRQSLVRFGRTMVFLRATDHTTRLNHRGSKDPTVSKFDGISTDRKNKPVPDSRLSLSLLYTRTSPRTHTLSLSFSLYFSISLSSVSLAHTVYTYSAGPFRSDFSLTARFLESKDSKLVNSRRVFLRKTLGEHTVINIAHTLSSLSLSL